MVRNKVFILVIAVVALVLGWRNFSAFEPGDVETRIQAIDKNNNTYQVVRVIDGDTIKIEYEGKIESVRFIGVNTPEIDQPEKEIESYGQVAAAFTRKLLSGKRVQMIFDTSQRDKYGRLLGYVYTSDGTFVNALLVKKGYAQVMTVPPDVTFQALFVELQRQARKERKGLWGIEKYRLENPI